MFSAMEAFSVCRELVRAGDIMTVKKAVLIGLVLEILLGCLAGAFYFKFYIYTPTYSIRAMQKALQTGDVEALKQRADLDGIFKQGNESLAQLVSKNDPAYVKLADGSFANFCEEDFLNYVKTGKWQERETITPESALEDKIGLRTVSFRSLEYVYRDPPPGQDEEESTTDKMLSLPMSLINKYGPGHEERAALEEAEAAQATDTDVMVTAGVKVYEPNLGDTFILKLKLKRQADGSWRLYAIENYPEYAGELLKQNDRDYIRYKEKVRNILTATQEKFDELRAKNDTRDMNWIIDARKIMDESNKQIDDLKVPVAGAYLNQLLKERKDIFYELLESYYDLNSQSQSMSEAKEAEQNRPAGKKQKRPVYNEGVWNNRITKANTRINEALQNWSENKAKLEGVVGPVIDRAAVAQTVAAVLRNNDDDFVRAVNYPTNGVNNSSHGDGANIPSLLDEGHVPTVSAYGHLN